MREDTVKRATVLVDVTLITGAAILLVFLLGVSPSRRGFFCEDKSIRYRYQKSTVPDWALIIYCLVIPITVITLTEWRLQRNRASGTFLTFSVPLWLITSYRGLVDFLFGLAASQLATDTAKLFVGRLRPNFIDACGPNINLSNCSLYGQNFIEDYRCDKSDDDAKEARLSFPSGHASASAFAMLYAAIFIQVKWRANRSALRLVKSALQLSLIFLAYFTALSRVMDNKVQHHAGDLAAGALIGTVSASLTARYVSGLVGPGTEEQDVDGDPKSLGPLAVSGSGHSD